MEGEQMDAQTAIVINRGVAYMSKKKIAQELELSIQTLNKYIDGIREQIAKGRYHRTCIAGNRYNVYAIIDYMTYRKELAEKNASKNVPPFDPATIAEESGYCTKLVRME